MSACHRLAASSENDNTDDDECADTLVVDDDHGGENGGGLISHLSLSLSPCLSLFFLSLRLSLFPFFSGGEKKAAETLLQKYPNKSINIQNELSIIYDCDIYVSIGHSLLP